MKLRSRWMTTNTLVLLLCVLFSGTECVIRCSAADCQSRSQASTPAQDCHQHSGQHSSKESCGVGLLFQAEKTASFSSTPVLVSAWASPVLLDLAVPCRSGFISAAADACPPYLSATDQPTVLRI